MRTHPSNSKHGVVCSDLLSALVSSTAVGDKYDDTSEKRNTSHGQDEDLGPSLGVLCPGGHPAVVGQGPSRVEDGQGCGKHGEDDEGAAEVDATKSHLGHADASLDFLHALLGSCSWKRWRGGEGSLPDHEPAPYRSSAPASQDDPPHGTSG